MEIFGILFSIPGAAVAATLGPLYYVCHVVLLLLGTPALMNTLVIPHPARDRAGFWTSVPLCTMLALVLVVQQYVVFEGLYGVDGDNGPFSKIDSRH